MKRVFTRSFFFIIIALLSFQNTIAQQDPLTYICPVPGSAYLNPEQNIILKSKSPFELQAVNEAEVIIYGSKSGYRQCAFMLSKEKKTLLIKPEKIFSLDEKVSVTVSGLKTEDGKTIPPVDFFFQTRKSKVTGAVTMHECCGDITAHESNRSHKKPRKGHWWTDNNLPDDFPGPIESESGYLSNLYTFTNLDARMLGTEYNNYSVILDNFGTPIYFQRTPNHNYFNLNVMPDGLLTWCRNYATASANEKYYIADSSYNIIDSVRTGNGYNLDSHDMLWMDNGHYLVMSYDPQPVNMSLIVPGGDPDAIVTGLIIQEVDNQENVFWQWRSWDHFEITDATPDINLLAPTIDYVHGNAFEFDDDGHLLLSSRNMDEITKINYNTGDLIWRFGKNASNNEFDIFNDPIGFSHQHDIRKMPNGHYTLYDNGNLHQSQFSRAMEYDIDEDLMQATLVWTYQHEPVIYAPATGSFRVMENEKRIVGWGATNVGALMTELNPDNTVSMELLVPDGVTSYRALKFPWETDLFSTLNDMSFGNFAGHDHAKELYLSITNNSSSIITLTSFHNHLSAYEVTSTFPIGIFPNGSAIITISFEPDEPGEYQDLLTLNYDNEDQTRRIARQVVLNGYWEDDIPAVFFDPVNTATNVDPSTEIKLMFSEPVRMEGGDEITNGNIPGIIMLKENDREGDDVLFGGTISDDKLTITLYPSAILKEEQQYYVELLADTVEDFDSNVLEYAEVCFFETGMAVGVVEHVGSEILVYPNPTNGTLMIRLKMQDSRYQTPVTRHASRITSVGLFSIDGRMVKEIEHDQVSGIFEKEIDISDLAQGLYFLKIESGDEVFIHKVIKLEH